MSQFQIVQNWTFRTGVLVVALAIAAGLWVWPALAFPNPGTNDAMVLANLTLPVVGAILLGSIVILVLGLARRWPSAASVGLGTFLVGVAVVFVIGLISFGNMSDDRFMPLLFLPGPFAVVGMVALVAGLSRRGEGTSGIGLTISGIATAVLLVWMLARGSRDWLLAPYGFDVFLMIALESALVFLLGATWRPSGSPRRLAST